MLFRSEAWWDLRHPLSKGRASDELNLIVVVVGRIKDTVRGTVGDEDVEALRDVVPDPVDRPTVLHIGPVTVAWGEWGAPESKSLDGLLLVDEEVDLPVFDEISGDESLLQGGVVVSWDKDLCGNRKGGEPVDEGPELRLVSVGVLPVRGVTGVDHDVDPFGDLELTVESMRVTYMPKFVFYHLTPMLSCYF